MTLPEQHAPPVYACAAGAVLHAHAGSTLEPAVVLHTLLPPVAGERLDSSDVRVDVSSDGPGSSTVTVRVLVEDQSLSWSLPLAPFVAALPGQSGDDGRMVLLALVDAEPQPGFWAEAVDCEHLAAELQLPVTDLAEALRGRLTPWLAEDLELLLHDDAHDRAVDVSPAQTVANAVLAQYRGDLDAGQSSTRLLQSLALAPDAFQLELGARLCSALAMSVRVAGPAAVSATLAATGPFEGEEQRLLTELPPSLAEASTPDTETALALVVSADDRDEAVRAAVRVVARLSRHAFGPDLPDAQLLQRLGMVDDAGLVRLARRWVDLALAAGGEPARDPAVVPALAQRIADEGVPGMWWLRGTAVGLVELSREVAGRRSDRLEGPLRVVAEYEPAVSEGVTAPTSVVRACLELARFARARGGVGPGSWQFGPAIAAAEAVLAALLDGADREAALDLLVELLERDVEAPELLDGLVCAAAQLLVAVDPHQDDDGRRVQLAELLASVTGGPRGERWLLAALLHLAPEHDPLALDLRPLLPHEAVTEFDRAATKLGRHGLLRAGLSCLEALVGVFGDEADLTRDELLGEVLPAALGEHELLRGDA